MKVYNFSEYAPCEQIYQFFVLKSSWHGIYMLYYTDGKKNIFINVCNSLEQAEFTAKAWAEEHPFLHG